MKSFTRSFQRALAASVVATGCLAGAIGTARADTVLEWNATAAALPIPAPRSTREHPAGLTSKEVGVLELLAAGLRNKEIALRLHRSARTIDHHLVAIFAKLGVATRAEAVSAAYRLGVVAAKSASA